jgi:hypothetical protein
VGVPIQTGEKQEKTRIQRDVNFRDIHVTTLWLPFNIAPSI